MTSFDTIWTQLQNNLEVNMPIKNWTAFNGYLGDEMTVVGVREFYIEVKSPNARNVQFVPKDDFKKVWEVWADYKSQKVRRYEIRNITRFSKYIISILHWYENA